MEVRNERRQICLKKETTNQKQMQMNLDFTSDFVQRQLYGGVLAVTVYLDLHPHLIRSRKGIQDN
jgi:hypothetical protein